MVNITMIWYIACTWDKVNTCSVFFHKFLWLFSRVQQAHKHVWYKYEHHRRVKVLISSHCKCSWSVMIWWMVLPIFSTGTIHGAERMFSPLGKVENCYHINEECLAIFLRHEIKHLPTIKNLISNTLWFCIIRIIIFHVVSLSTCSSPTIISSYHGKPQPYYHASFTMSRFAGTWYSHCDVVLFAQNLFKLITV